MSSRIKNFLILLAIFALAFTSVWFIREDTTSLLRYTSKNDSEGASYDLLKKSLISERDITLLNKLDQEYATVTDTVTKSVVSLDTIGKAYLSTPYQNYKGNQQEYSIRGMGSGVIVSRQGHIITNTHVVENKDTIQVTLFDGRTFLARKIGEDKVMDIAVLKIDAGEKLTPLAFGDSDAVRVGQIVFAVGNPFGLGETVTQGIISAKQRSVGDLQSELFQTDAAINPGNSGGPLVNIKGEIIGINAAIYSKEKNNAAFNGVGFSIPSNTVKNIFEEICEFGKPIRGYIGVALMDLTPRIKTLLNFDREEGVAINSLHDNSPAYTAGLRAGDIILACNGQMVDNARTLLRLIHVLHIGKPVVITYWRAGEEKKISVTVAEAGIPLPSDQSVSPIMDSLKKLGIELRDITMEEYLSGLRGVLITKVDSTKEVAKYFAPGYLITQINGQPIRNRDSFTSLIGNKNTFEITVIGRFKFDVTITLPSEPVPANTTPSPTTSAYRQP